ncbi:MAG: carboxypeptidase-like regulatory domain-containing protein [Desulfarculaceae bacterium]|nr:carboxypeptidase-like regulatory domain-containing protein [Desulfarculaceae bacterium]
MFRPAVLLALLAALLCLPAPPAQAGSAQGSLSGAVVNRYGEPLRGATVRVEHLQEGFVVESIADGQGTYVINNLSPGDYKVEASIGSKKADLAVQKTKLGPGENKRLNLVINIVEGRTLDPNYRPLKPGLLGTP